MDLRTRALVSQQHKSIVTAKGSGDFAIRIIKITEDARARRAAYHAHGLFPAVGALFAHRAFLSNALRANRDILVPVVEIGIAHRLVPIEYARVVRACCHAHTAANALVVIDFYTALVIFVGRARRAHPQASRVFTMLTCDGDIGALQIWIAAKRTVDHIASLGEHAVP